MTTNSSDFSRILKKKFLCALSFLSLQSFPGVEVQIISVQGNTIPVSIKLKNGGQKDVNKCHVRHVSFIRPKNRQFRPMLSFVPHKFENLLINDVSIFVNNVLLPLGFF